MTTDARTRREKLSDAIYVNWPVVAIFVAIGLAVSLLAVLFLIAVQHLVDAEVRHLQHVVTTTTIRRNT